MPNNNSLSRPSIGYWIKRRSAAQIGQNAIRDALLNVQEHIALIELDGQLAAAQGGIVTLDSKPDLSKNNHPLFAFAPPLRPQSLGDPAFLNDYGLKFPYVAGAMANGITSVEMVKAMGLAGMIGFFGAAGLTPDKIENAIDQLAAQRDTFPFGFNLIHNPAEPDLEAAIVALYLRKGIRLVSASAYLRLTLPLVLYRVKGIHRGPGGSIICPNKIMAKVSRIEVAKSFFSPPPDKILKKLQEQGKISAEEALLAKKIPMARDLTAEADSGGHTDNRPALTLLPTIMALRDKISQRYNFEKPLRVGLGGGIATPQSAAAAFGMGAAYILTGSINQACVESGASPIVRDLLAKTLQADVTMAPSADMFEMGIKVQVLKRGTLFPFRAAKLYQLYTMYDNYDQIPPKERLKIEKDYFRGVFDEVWEETKTFFVQRDPKQIERADRDPKHKMALVFRSYLGRSSGWANSGDPSRIIDYQIWCGPAMGAFNQWVEGSFLQKPEKRQIVTVALNLLVGASVITRFNWLRSQMPQLPSIFGRFTPLPKETLTRLLHKREEQR